jgi:hypothetical protein
MLKQSHETLFFCFKRLHYLQGTLNAFILQLLHNQLSHNFVSPLILPFKAHKQHRLLRKTKTVLTNAFYDHMG